MSKFVLIGGGEISTREIEKIDKYILSLARKKRPSVLFFPTAAQDSEAYLKTFEDYYLSLGAGTVKGAMLLTESHDEILKKMKEADIIYLGGGNTAMLINEFNKWELVDVLRRLAENDVVIAGISAGAIAMGEFGELKEVGIPCKEGNNYLGCGWGLIPKLLCIPHFQDNQLVNVSEIHERFPDLEILTLPDKQAMLVETENNHIVTKTLIDSF